MVIEVGGSVMTDNVPFLIGQLCTYHLEQCFQRQANATCFHQLGKKQLKQRRLKIKAFETLFQYLESSLRKMDGFGTKLSAVDRVLSHAFHLRSQRRFEDASRLEKLLRLISTDGPSDNVVCVLDFLLSLQDSIQIDDSVVIGHRKDFPHVANTGRSSFPSCFTHLALGAGLSKRLANSMSQISFSQPASVHHTYHPFNRCVNCLLLDEIFLPSGPQCYGDTRIDQTIAHDFMHYPREIFEARGCNSLEMSRDHLPLCRSFIQTPGSHLLAFNSSDKTANLSTAYSTSLQGSLFGSMVHSRVTNLDAVLDIPSLSDYEEPALPRFRARDRMEASEDEGFFDAQTTSVDSSLIKFHENSSSRLSSDDFWSDALSIHLNDRYTWEAIGRVAADAEKPYLTEAGCHAFDKMRAVYQGCRLDLIDECASRAIERPVSMKELVVDVIQLLLGIPSKSFLWQQDHFVVACGLCTLGISPESLSVQCSDLLQCGTHYHMLSEFSRSHTPRSTDNYGLILEAFRRGLRQYLLHYQACIISVQLDSAYLTILSISCRLRKLIAQIQFLMQLCCLNCNSREDSTYLPEGFRLLSYIYGECLVATCNDNYSVLLFLLRCTVEPYLCMVHDWVFHGICADMFDEFMLQVNQEYLGRRDELYWTRSYIPAEDDIADSVPVFLADLAAQIFLCGKSINLLKLCTKSEHFLVAEDRLQVPPLRLALGNSSLQNTRWFFTAYFEEMRSLARQKLQTRAEVKVKMEKARQDLQARVRRAATDRLQRTQGAALKLKVKEDARKRKLFTELKQQMEQDLRQKVIEREEKLAADKAYMESVNKRELLEASHDLKLVEQAREELIEQYTKLNRDVEIREKRAQWKVRRHQLDKLRSDFLAASASKDNDLPITVKPATKSLSEVLLDVGRGSPLKRLILSFSSPDLSAKSAIIESQGDLRDTLSAEDLSDSTYIQPEHVVSSMHSDDCISGKPRVRILSAVNEVLENRSGEPLGDWSVLGGETHECSAMAQPRENLLVNSEIVKSEPSATVQRNSLLAMPVTDNKTHTKTVTGYCVTRETTEAEQRSHLKMIPGRQVSDVSLAFVYDSTSKTADHSIEKSVETIHNNETDDDPQFATAKPQDQIDQFQMVITSVKEIFEDRDAAEADLEGQTDYLARVSSTPMINVLSEPSRHVSAESECAEIRVSKKMVANSQVSDESSFQQEQIHLRLNANINATSESVESVLKTSIKPVVGKNISVESSSTGDVAIRSCIRVSTSHRASTESNLPEQKMQERIGIPRLKRSQVSEAAELSSWADFTNYQVCRSFAPRRGQVLGQSIDKESANSSLASEFDAPEKRVRSRIKMSKSMSAVAESQHVDGENLRRQRFVVQNKHGHASDSSIQRLLYGDVTAAGIDGAMVMSTASEDEEKSMLPSPWVDQCVAQYEDSYACFDQLPVADLTAWKKAHRVSVEENKKTEEDLEMLKVTGLPILLERSVIEPLRAQISMVNEIIVNYFMVELSINDHFATLHQFLLLQDGEFAQSVTDQLFDKLTNCRRQSDFLNPMNLNEILRKSIAASAHPDSELAANLSFVVRSTPKSMLKTASDGLDYLELNYKVNWPINLIIVDSVLKKYSRIFTFMLKLKRAAWVLKATFHRLKRDGMRARGLCQQMHALQLYRHEMQHFVKVLHEYVANQVVTVLWHEFQTSLSERIDGVDDLRQVHANYIDKAMSRCLLSGNAAPVLKIINSMFGLILSFNAQLTSRSWQLISPSDQLQHPGFDGLYKTYITFHEHSLFLFKVVDQLLSRGFQPHFDELLLRLNFNGFYMPDKQLAQS